jgi:homoserine kinase type II
MTLSRLVEIHLLMKVARNKGLLFVPTVLTSEKGTTYVVYDDRHWDLTTWMEGEAASPTRVSLEQVDSAFTALALLHGAWASREPSRGPCPGVLRRLQGFREWEKVIHAGWGLPLHSSDPAHAWAERAFKLLEAHAKYLPRKLEDWLDRSMTLQPCLCDIWHDHVLFEGDLVTGIVDYGGVKTDHVAVDLARLLGSLVDDRADLRAGGLHAYARLCPLTLEEEELVTVLDETGALVGLITWLKWLYLENRQFDSRDLVIRRLQALVERVERMMN